MSKSPQALDARSLALHGLVADRLERDPDLLQMAQRTLAGWRQRVSPHSQPYLAQWEALLQQGLGACVAVLRDPSEAAHALRLCSPFAGALPAKERWAFLRDWKEGHEAA